MVLAGAADARMCVERMSHEAIATALSYAPGTRTDRIGAALRRLEDHGFIAITRRGARRCDRYQIRIHAADHGPGQASGYDVVPYAMRHALRAKTITPTVMVSWLRIEQVLGAHGWTTNTLTQLATRCTTSARTLATHITTLTLTGFLTRSTLPTGTTLLTIGPATDSTPTNTPTAVGSGPATSTANQPAKAFPEVRRQAGRPEETAGSPQKKVRGLNKSLTHEGLTHENSLAGFAKRSHLGKGLTTCTGRERPKPTNPPIHTRPRTPTTDSTGTHTTQTPAQTAMSVVPDSPATRHTRSTQNPSSASDLRGSWGSRDLRSRTQAAGGLLRNAYTQGPISRRDVRQVLTTLPAEWISGPNYQWLPGLAGRIATWLDGTTSTTGTSQIAAMTASAIVEALTCIGSPDYLPASILASADIAVRQMRAEQRAHLRCTICGHTLTTTSASTPMGQCWACLEDTTSPALPAHIAYPDDPDDPEDFDEHDVAAALRALPLDQRIDLAGALIDLYGRHQTILTLLDTDPDVATHFINQDHQSALATNGAHRVRAAYHASRTIDHATNDPQQDGPVPTECRMRAAEIQHRGSSVENVGHGTITLPAALTLITPLRLIKGNLAASHRQVSKGSGLRYPSSPCSGVTSRVISNAPCKSARPADHAPLHVGMCHHRWLRRWAMPRPAGTPGRGQSSATTRGHGPLRAPMRARIHAPPNATTASISAVMTHQSLEDARIGVDEFT